MYHPRFVVLATVVALLASPVLAQSNTQRGAVLGGLGGAVAGGLIGDHNDRAGAGAAIGGAIGVVAGAVLGNARDQDLAVQRYQTRQQVQFVRQAAVSMADVINMSRGGLSDAVIINQIQQRGVRDSLQVSDIIHLHQQGVSDVVITALQQGPPPPATYLAPAVARPVVVEEYYVAPTYVMPGPPVYYHHYHAPPPRHYHYGGGRATFSARF